jgi:hypothetical protein
MRTAQLLLALAGLIGMYWTSNKPLLAQLLFAGTQILRGVLPQLRHLFQPQLVIAQLLEVGTVFLLQLVEAIREFVLGLATALAGLFQRLPLPISLFRRRLPAGLHGRDARPAPAATAR